MAESTRPPFPAGVSPNPGGRPKDTEDMKRAKAAAKAATPDMVDVLVDIAKNGEHDPSRVSAAVAVLDRAFGKPAQAITGPDGSPLQLGGDDLRAQLTRALYEMANPARPAPIETTAEVVGALPAKDSEK